MNTTELTYVVVGLMFIVAGLIWWLYMLLRVLEKVITRLDELEQRSKPLHPLGVAMGNIEAAVRGRPDLKQ